jgi:hypothetical protein
LARKLAPALGDVCPHTLFGVFVRACGPFVSQCRAGEKSLLHDVFWRVHAFSLTA